MFLQKSAEEIDSERVVFRSWRQERARETKREEMKEGVYPVRCDGKSPQLFVRIGDKCVPVVHATGEWSVNTGGRHGLRFRMGIGQSAEPRAAG